MKMKFVQSVLASALLLFSGVVFSSCEKDDNILPNPPDVPELLVVPEGFRVSYHTYARGTQVYECQETSAGVYGWVFKNPLADLFAKSNFSEKVGTHYGGPTWESSSGSWVKAAKLEGVTVDDTAVPWLLLGSTDTQGPGVFEGTTHIQRVNTVGGLAPTQPANAGNVGQQVQVPYTAEYYFYKAK